MPFEKLPIVLSDLNADISFRPTTNSFYRFTTRISSSNIIQKTSSEDIFADLIKEVIIKNKKFSNECNSFKPNATDIINTPIKLSVKIEKTKAAIVNLLFHFKSQYGEFLKFP